MDEREEQGAWALHNPDSHTQTHTSVGLLVGTLSRTHQTGLISQGNLVCLV